MFPDSDLSAAAAYTAAAERRLAERADAALQWARLRRRQGEATFSVKVLAARQGWAYRTAVAAVEHLERLGAAVCVARRGRDVWALTGGADRR
jgi:hypothetical protein